MSLANPYAIETRVYYEDTDSGGVVYYANYLRFFERCRTEWMRAAGHDQSELAREHNLAFVVRRVEVDYRKPARLDDFLRIDLVATLQGRARIICQQNATLIVANQDDKAEAKPLVSANVELACINVVDFRPVPVPDWLSEKLRSAAPR